MSRIIKINASPTVLLYALEGVLWNLKSQDKLENADYWIQFLQQLRMEYQAAAMTETVVEPKRRKMSELKRKRLSRAMKKYHKERRAAAASVHNTKVAIADKRAKKVK